MHEPVAVVDLLRSLFGRRLEAVTEARHWFEGKREDDARSLLHFWLHFAGAPTVQAHSYGEVLELVQAEPYAAYDMEQYGETRVALAEPPDLLASVVGQILRDAALIQGYSSRPSVGGLRLRFDRDTVVVASLGDEWVLCRDGVPSGLQQYLEPGPWLSRME